MTTITKKITLSMVLKSLLDDHKISGIRLANAVGLPPQTVNRLVSGQVTDPKSSTVRSIADYFGLTLDQLLGNAPLPTATEPLHRRHALPIPQRLLSAGKLTSTEPSSFFYWPVPSLMQGELTAILCDTDRYAPMILNQTILIIDLASTPEENDLVILETNQGLVLKKFQSEGDETYFYPLHPGQKIYNTTELPYHHLGVILESISRFKSR